MMSVFHHTPQYFRKALEYIDSGEIEVELITETLPLEKLSMQWNSILLARQLKFLIKTMEIKYIFDFYPCNLLVFLFIKSGKR